MNFGHNKSSVLKISPKNEAKKDRKKIPIQPIEAEASETSQKSV